MNAVAPTSASPVSMPRFRSRKTRRLSLLDRFAKLCDRIGHLALGVLIIGWMAFNAAVAIVAVWYIVN